MKLFEDLEWGPAFKRAAFLVAFWLLALYVLTVAFPETFVLGLDSSAGVVSMLINAVLFFFFFAVFTAFTERSKRRRAAAIKAQRKGGTSARAAGAKNRSGVPEDGEEAGPGDLRGRHNPNTSRKKTARQRRRR
ncbi:MAG: hypothetical protein M3289_05605 [Actinomycetota bacterium]|jgi:hypothetical protein|nr:hypothetical protein [Actinomycetota bacterium]MDQ3860130.1 hypothetical protein [Actinomycetota bacterium]MDQ5814178.1 hypothetical protein [Actinomycetota bacterium]